MDMVIAYWAGEERQFRLRLGEVWDLEEACGGLGIGEIYQRMGQHRYSVRHVSEILRLGLIGGGIAPVAAKALVRDRFDTVPLVQSFEAALEVLLGLMAGVAPQEGEGASTSDPSAPQDVGEVLAALLKMGVAPQDARQIRYPDFLRLLRAMPSNKEQAPTEEEFNQMVERAIELGHMPDPGAEGGS